MKLCRQALEEADDNVDQAIAWLQENEEARAQ
jgi:translation elongation factor EF-Ts